MEKETKVYGIRAVIEAINSDKTLDKVFVQKGLRGDLFMELDTLLRKHAINISYVPIEKLNRLTKNLEKRHYFFYLTILQMLEILVQLLELQNAQELMGL